MDVLKDALVRAELRLAWEESQPGALNAHEEGGFILRTAEGGLVVERWPRGARNEIHVPPHPGGKYAGKEIAATFHTHPNAGPDFQQQPSMTDVRAVRNDPDLRHATYHGEYVISKEMVYRIDPEGNIEELGSPRSLLQ